MEEFIERHGYWASAELEMDIRESMVPREDTERSAILDIKKCDDSIGIKLGQGSTAIIGKELSSSTSTVDGVTTWRREPVLQKKLKDVSVPDKYDEMKDCVIDQSLLLDLGLDARVNNDNHNDVATTSSDHVMVEEDIDDSDDDGLEFVFTNNKGSQAVLKDMQRLIDVKNGDDLDVVTVDTNDTEDDDNDLSFDTLGLSFDEEDMELEPNINDEANDEIAVTVLE